MANELILAFGTTKTLEANGASIASAAIGQANDASYGVVADGANFPHAKFVLSGSFSVAPSENTVLLLSARTINIDGTNDAEVPEATRTGIPIGQFVLNNVTSTQYIECIAFDVPWEADYYIYNANSGQTLATGWTLKVTPFTYKPA